MDIYKEQPKSKSEMERYEMERYEAEGHNARYKFLELVRKIEKIIECAEIGQNKSAQLNLIISAGILFGEAGDELKAYMNNQIKYYELKEKAENAEKEKGEE